MEITIPKVGYQRPKVKILENFTESEQKWGLRLILEFHSKSDMDLPINLYQIHRRNTWKGWPRQDHPQEVTGLESTHPSAASSASGSVSRPVTNASSGASGLACRPGVRSASKTINPSVLKFHNLNFLETDQKVGKKVGIHFFESIHFEKNLPVTL